MSLKTNTLANTVLEQDSTTLNYDLAMAQRWLVTLVTSVNKTQSLSVSDLTGFGIWIGI